LSKAEQTKAFHIGERRESKKDSVKEYLAVELGNAAESEELFATSDSPIGGNMDLRAFRDATSFLSDTTSIENLDETLQPPTVKTLSNLPDTPDVISIDASPRPARSHIEITPHKLDAHPFYSIYELCGNPLVIDVYANFYKCRNIETWEGFTVKIIEMSRSGTTHTIT
jgi:hypothetical protein